MSKLDFIAKNLKVIRSRYGFTQNDMADVLELSLGQYKSYEGARTLPGLDSFIKLQRLTGINIESLYLREIDIMELKLDYDVDRLEGLTTEVSPDQKLQLQRVANYLKSALSDIESITEKGE